MSQCCNISNSCPIEYNKGLNIEEKFKDSIQYLPDSIRKEIRLLSKQYHILSIEHCGEKYSFNGYGVMYELDFYTMGNKIIKIREQKYDVKIEYKNKETGQEFFKVLLSYN